MYAPEVYKNRNAKAKSVLELADKCKMTGNYVLELFYCFLFLPIYLKKIGFREHLFSRIERFQKFREHKFSRIGK